MNKIKQWKTYNDDEHKDIIAPIKYYNFLEFSEQDITDFVSRIVTKFKNYKNKFMVEDIESFILNKIPHLFVEVNIEQKGKKSKKIKLLLNAFECNIDGKTSKMLSKEWVSFMSQKFGKKYDEAHIDYTETGLDSQNSL